MTREEAIKILKSKMDGSVDTSYEWAEAVRMAIEALSAEIVHKPDYSYEADMVRRLKKALSVEAVQGEWVIEDAHTEHCSVCGYVFYISALFAVGGNDEPNYCPNCGAKMKGGTE